MEYLPNVCGIAFHLFFCLSPFIPPCPRGVDLLARLSGSVDPFTPQNACRAVRCCCFGMRSIARHSDHQLLTIAHSDRHLRAHHAVSDTYRCPNLSPIGNTEAAPRDSRLAAHISMVHRLRHRFLRRTVCERGRFASRDQLHSV